MVRLSIILFTLLSLSSCNLRKIQKVKTDVSTSTNTQIVRQGGKDSLPPVILRERDTIKYVINNQTHTVYRDKDKFIFVNQRSNDTTNIKTDTKTSTDTEIPVVKENWFEKNSMMLIFAGLIVLILFIKR